MEFVLSRFFLVLIINYGSCIQFEGVFFFVLEHQILQENCEIFAFHFSINHFSTNDCGEHTFYLVDLFKNMIHHCIPKLLVCPFFKW